MAFNPRRRAQEGARSDGRREPFPDRHHGAAFGSDLDYWLGGKDNYPVDRQAGEQTIAVLPEIVDIARASRQFLARVVRYLAADAGIRQFLDVGTGLPTVNNTHEVAQRAAPESRVVYVDNAVQDMDEYCALGRTSAA